MNPTIAYVMKKPANREIDRPVFPAMMTVDMKNEPKSDGVFEGVKVYPIAGWEGLYSVSKCGKVWSHQRRVKCNTGTRVHPGRWRLLPKDRQGYLTVSLSRGSTMKKTFYIHRLVSRTFRGRTPRGLEIDHRDRDKSNNNIHNLRFVTVSQNQMNRGLRSDNTSGAKGVSWHKDYGKWCARVHYKGAVAYLRFFDDKGEAIRARDEAARKLHGDFAVLNNP